MKERADEQRLFTRSGAFRDDATVDLLEARQQEFLDEVAAVFEREQCLRKVGRDGCMVHREHPVHDALQPRAFRHGQGKGIVSREKRPNDDPRCIGMQFDRQPLHDPGLPAARSSR